jgi:hypothetical protein
MCNFSFLIVKKTSKYNSALPSALCRKISMYAQEFCDCRWSHVNPLWHVPVPEAYGQCVVLSLFLFHVSRRCIDVHLLKRMSHVYWHIMGSVNRCFDSRAIQFSNSIPMKASACAGWVANRRQAAWRSDRVSRADKGWRLPRDVRTSGMSEKTSMSGRGCGIMRVSFHERVLGYGGMPGQRVPTWNKTL